MEYRVFIELSNGKEIKFDTQATSDNEACQLAVSSQKVADMLNNDNIAVKNIHAAKLQARFEYRVILNKEDMSSKIRVTDNEKGTVVEFISGHYNDTAKVVKKPNSTDKKAVAEALSDISEYVGKYHRRDCFDGESLLTYISKSLSNAMNKAGVTAYDLANNSGVVRGHIVGTLNETHPIRAIELLQLCEAMGAELKIVFPEDE